MNSVSEQIDELGLLKAQIAALKDREAALKSSLILAGVDTAEGELYRVTIRATVRRTLDSALIRKLVPKALLRKAEKESESVTVRVTARKGTVAAKAA